jgi:hypothetical protein
MIVSRQMHDENDSDAIATMMMRPPSAYPARSLTVTLCHSIKAALQF